MRIGDLDALLELYDMGKELEEYAEVLSVPIPVIRQNIKDMPTIDAAPVIRCKDCAVPHNKWTGCPKLNGLIPPADFYCGFGEPKDGK